MSSQGATARKKVIRVNLNEFNPDVHSERTKDLTPTARRFLYESILSSIDVGTRPPTKITAKVLADVKRMRALWAVGKSDLEVKKLLRLTAPMWEHRFSLLGTVPADEDSIAAFNRYSAAHQKFVAKAEQRLQRLHLLYKKAKKIDLDTANSTLSQMHTVDQALLKAEAELITIKQKLCLLAEPVKKVQLDGVIGVTTLEEVWRNRLRKKMKDKMELKARSIDLIEPDYTVDAAD